MQDYLLTFIRNHAILFIRLLADMAFAHISLVANSQVALFF